MLDEAGSCSLRHTILSLVEELERKDAVLSELTTTPPPPPPAGEEEGDGKDVVERLRVQVTQLQYTNARLKVELMNR